jgi:hypothetical protein
LSVQAKNREKIENYKIKLTADERIRYYYRRNLLDMENSSGNNSSYMQFRTRLGAKVKFTPRLKAEFRLINENKSYFYPSNKYEVDEAVFDKFYILWERIAETPLTLKIGRQDIWFGEGFVIAEGTPGDGPRTIYFNAVRAALNYSDNKFDIFLIRQDKKDQFIKINNQDTNLNNNKTKPNVEAAGLYFTNNSFKNHQIETYYLYKREFSTAVESKINTIGLRLSSKSSPGWAYGAESAFQIGKTGSEDKQALGLTAHLTYSFLAKFNPSLKLEYTYLSGDNPNTAKDEGWNPLFSQWPKWSLLYTYILNNEDGMAYWTNIYQWRLINTLNFTDKQKLDLVYSYLRADDNNLGAKFGEGKERGHLFQAIYNVNFNQCISGRIKAEYFEPGNYYSASADPGLLLQCQLILKY